MKLTKKSLIELLRIMEDGGTVYQAKKKTGNIPELGHDIGRPSRAILPEEERIVREAYEKYRICASRLKKFINKDYNVDLSHYHVHKIMLKLGLAKLNGRKDVRKKKWVRYERRHSLTAVHMDWLYHPKLKLWALPVIDDSSRKLLALEEVKNATTDASIDAMKEALRHGEIQQCITDHGPQFTSNERGKSRFKDFIDSKAIQHILCKIKHPQSNGKSEKFGDLYLRHRIIFKTKEDFINWYNNTRPHMSLDERTPEEVYQERKKKLRRYYT